MAVNHRVRGSSPRWGAKYNKGLAKIRLTPYCLQGVFYPSFTHFLFFGVSFPPDDPLCHGINRVSLSAPATMKLSPYPHHIRPSLSSHWSDTSLGMIRKSVMFMQPLAVSRDISIQNGRSTRTLGLYHVPMRSFILALHDTSLYVFCCCRHDSVGILPKALAYLSGATICFTPGHTLTRESLIAGTAIGLCCGANKRCSGLSRNSPGEKNYFPAPPGMTRKWKKGAHGVPSIPSMNAITRSGKKRMLPGSPPRPSNLRISYIKTVSPKNFGRFENRCCDLAEGRWCNGFLSSCKCQNQVSIASRRFRIVILKMSGIENLY